MESPLSATSRISGEEEEECADPKRKTYTKNIVVWTTGREDLTFGGEPYSPNHALHTYGAIEIIEQSLLVENQSMSHD